MRLLDTVLLSALEGLTQVLPLSRSGHEAVAGLWLEQGRSVTALMGLLQIGTAAAIAVVTRRRLTAAMSEGVRGIARPTLFRTSPAAHDAAILVVASLASLITAALAQPYMDMWAGAPVAVGFGLLVTGFGVASTVLAPKPHAEAPSLASALVVGIAHGLAVFPGASSVGAALTLLVWLGVKPGRAIDLALLITLPTLLASFGQALVGLRHSAETGLDTGTIAVGLTIAFVSAAMAVRALRGLMVRRRIGALALWIIPLGLATIAYARALPSFRA